jgi:thiol-disulfide isomerase/thioredoxin
MTDHRRPVWLPTTAVAILLVAAACTASAGSSPPVADRPSESNAGPASPAALTPSPALSASPEVAPSDPPKIALTQAWATALLTDVTTGEPFRIADLAGKVVIIETMAIWCSNCRVQQGEAKAALARLPASSVVYVALDIDPNEDGPSLAAYREQNDFEGIYAIAGKDVARALAADFGDQVLNPPSTPMIIVGTDGAVTRTDFGIKSSDDIVATAEAHGA